MHNYSSNGPLFKSRSHTTFWSGVNSKGVSTGTLKWRMESKANKSPSSHRCRQQVQSLRVLFNKVFSTSDDIAHTQTLIFFMCWWLHTKRFLLTLYHLGLKETESKYCCWHLEINKGILGVSYPLNELTFQFGISASQYNKLNLFTHNLIDYSCILNQKQRDIWLCKPLIIFFLANDQEELIKLLKGRVTRYLVIV